MLFCQQELWAKSALDKLIAAAIILILSQLQKPVGELYGSYTVLFYTCLTKKNDSGGRAGKNAKLWDQLQTTVWDKSTIPCENGSHSNLWIDSRLTDSNSGWWSRIKGQFLAPAAEAHQTGAKLDQGRAGTVIQQKKGLTGVLSVGLIWSDAMLLYRTLVRKNNIARSRRTLRCTPSQPRLYDFAITCTLFHSGVSHFTVRL